MHTLLSLKSDLDQYETSWRSSDFAVGSAQISSKLFFFSTFKLTLACLLFVHHILEFMIIQHIMKSHAALAAVVFPLG